MSSKLLIRNGFVVSMDPEVGDIPNGEVFVEDGKIVDIGRDLGVSDAEQVDATGTIVMPGFVDTHRHTWQTPVRGVLRRRGLVFALIARATVEVATAAHPDGELRGPVRPRR